MKQPLPIFTPSLASYEVLKQLFVARDQLLDDIVERIRAAAATPSRNHTLLLGPRGAGKTHVVSLAYYRAAELRNAGELAVQLAWLPEDPWATTSYKRLLDAVLDHVEPAVPAADRPAADAVEHFLTDRSAELGPVVLFIENLDQVLDAIGTEGQQRLRHLAQERTLLFVASTTVLSRDLSDQAAPFYSFFTTTRLEPLSVDDAAAMLRGIAEYQEQPDIASYLETEQAAARLRAVAHLAGGQPRIWALLSQALTVQGLDQLVQLLLTRFDELTPYYQEQLARLSPQQRDIVVTLAELDHPVSVKELAESTGHDQRSLAKTLVELRGGWVAETDSLLTQFLDQRRTYYELGEPLARLAFQLKASRGTPIRLIIEFLKGWFDREDLVVDDFAEDALTVEYVRQAGVEQGTDAVLAVSRRLRALPASRVPILDVLGHLDDACARLAEGDAEPLLKMPSALRSAVEARLQAALSDGTPLEPAVVLLRVSLHVDALKEFGFVPHPVGAEWERRGRGLAGRAEAHPNALVIFGGWLARCWRFPEAEEVVLEIERQLGSDDVRTLAARALLAHCYWSAGRITEAILIEEQVLVDQEKILGPDHPVTLTTRSNLSTSYESAGRTAEAIDIKQRVLSDSERVLGPDHLRTVSAKANLAASYWSAGRTQEAIAIEEQVVRVRERLLGPDHPDSLLASGNLAASYQSAGRIPEAIALGERVASDADRVFGVDHAHSLTAWTNLASSYRMAGRTSEAVVILERALAGRERLLGSDHPDSITARSNLASCYWSAGQVTEAIVIEERVVADRERVLGPEHPLTLTAWSNLAASYQLANRGSEAVEIEQRVLADRERLLGPDHPDTVGSRGNLASSFWSMGDFAQAIVIEEQVLADRERLLGLDHPHTILARANLAISYHSVGRLSEAVALKEQVVTDREQIFGADHPETIDARAALALSYHASGRVDDARSLFNAALSASERVLGSDDRMTIRLREHLTALPKPSKAKKPTARRKPKKSGSK